MTKLEDKTNNEIIIELKQMEYNHEALKQKMLRDYDEMVKLEEAFKLGHKIINDRLKG